MSRHGFAGKLEDRHDHNQKVWRTGYEAGLAGEMFKANTHKDNLASYDFCLWTQGWAFGRHSKALKDIEDEDDL